TKKEFLMLNSSWHKKESNFICPHYTRIKMNNRISSSRRGFIYNSKKKFLSLHRIVYFTSISTQI
ncbi:MAG: hypothetical protein KBF99_17630, partial [Leptospiraceae bacterium]|nr:hypothetical protein [Leptospiraceae bacterium]